MATRYTHRPARRGLRGFVLLDTVGGLLLLLVTILLLSSITTRSRIVGRRLSADRAATRLAETALLRSAADGSAVAEGVKLHVLDTPAPDMFVWAEATAVVDGRRASLTGLIRKPLAAAEVPR